MEIGDRVYHKGVRANGIIVDLRGDEYKDRLKVQFFWAKYCKDIPHGEWRGTNHTHGRKWMWTREESLVKSFWFEGPNTVGLLGSRSLEALIRNVCEIPRYATSRGQGLPRHNIAINYGGGTRMVHADTFVVNANPIWDKFVQQNLMGPEIGLVCFCPVTQAPLANAENWIIKPRRSIGGKDIRPALGDQVRPGEYYQQFFPKIREFRAHCFMWMTNKVPMIQEKVIKNRDQLTWNKKQGGKFRYVYQEDNNNGKYMGQLEDVLRERISELSILACQKLGYDMGGIDIGMDNEGNLAVFEVNSRMGLREQSLFTYKRAFNGLKALDFNAYLEGKNNA